MPRTLLRAIPPINDIVDAEPLAEWKNRISRDRVVAAVRGVVAEYRQEVAASSSSGCRSVADYLAVQAAQRLREWEANILTPVINATGILIHTGLGRAPLASSAIESLLNAAQGYVALEIDLQDGQRGDRLKGIRELLRDLTGAETATIVNNGAAALVVALACVAGGREVIVSRGELIEIGGGFRLPEIMAASGARLVEVGTTNKTRAEDYEVAINDATAAILKVHPSNFQQSGFVESVDVKRLAKLAHRSGVPLIHDIGSGAIFDIPQHNLTREPVAADSIAAGVDLVLFSGDKLLGGPQAGILVGIERWIQRIERHPLMRAMRVDKLTLAALGATLRLHADKYNRVDRVPLLSMMTASLDTLQRRAEAIAQQLAMATQITAEVIESTAYVGGGALPRQSIASAALRLQSPQCSEGELARRLRTGTPAVVAYIQDAAVLLNMRTIFPAQDDQVTAAILGAIDVT